MKKESLATFKALSEDSRSDWMDAQADLSRHLVHMSFCWFCRAPAQTLSFYNDILMALVIDISLFKGNSWNEPRHDKTNKVSERPAKTQISLGIRPVWSESSLSVWKAWVLSYPLSIQRRLIRLGRCPGWSESSLGAQSLCWFCHVVAQMNQDSNCRYCKAI